MSVDSSLSREFTALLGRYTANTRLRDTLWREISRAYSAQGRHYHTLAHLEHMLYELRGFQRKVSETIRDWDSLLFALYYHDLVYVPASDKNEAQSAEIAALRLGEIGFPPRGIEKTRRLIRATQKHMAVEDEDTNCFMDADLSILGQSREIYLDYAKRVRREYAMFPQPVYNAGRIKALRSFLEMPAIFKTRHFHEHFELQARKNLIAELAILNAPLPLEPP
ncbi:MAG: hypothetical protein LBU53_06130 [Zoogloeaceae bacterium]|jgi:predicted metal-dependent HD superfamily phosphohydrolase|nr:hypothetical protein [Zoogloeaceae bacterium]